MGKGGCTDCCGARCGLYNSYLHPRQSIRANDTLSWGTWLKKINAWPGRTRSSATAAQQIQILYFSPLRELRRRKKQLRCCLTSLCLPHSNGEAAWIFAIFYNQGSPNSNRGQPACGLPRSFQWRTAALAPHQLHFMISTWCIRVLW